MHAVTPFPRTMQVGLRLPVNQPRRQAWEEDSPPRRRSPLPSPWAAAVGSKELATAGSRHSPKPSQACLMPLPRTSPITTWVSQQCREHKASVEKDQLTLVSISEFSVHKVGSLQYCSNICINAQTPKQARVWQASHADHLIYEVQHYLSCPRL